MHDVVLVKVGQPVRNLVDLIDEMSHFAQHIGNFSERTMRNRSAIGFPSRYARDVPYGIQADTRLGSLDWL